MGAHLLNGAKGTMVEIYYWRDRGNEVDFVLQSGERIVSVEVKSGRARSDYSGMDAFAKNFQPFRKLLLGGCESTIQPWNIESEPKGFIPSDGRAPTSKVDFPK